MFGDRPHLEHLCNAGNHNTTYGSKTKTEDTQPTLVDQQLHDAPSCVPQLEQRNMFPPGLPLRTYMCHLPWVTPSDTLPGYSSWVDI